MMGYLNREIEKKYAVEDDRLSYEQVCSMVQDAVCLPGWIDLIKDGSKDIYWNSNNPKTADFIRLRFMPNGSGQMTTKFADCGSNVDRVEIDVEVGDPGQASKFLCQVLGNPRGTIYKYYMVLAMDRQDTTISVYKVIGHKSIFIEIEARNVEIVDRLAGLVMQKIEMKQEPRSLYQILFGASK